MKLMVTGGAGFIASNFIRYVLSKYPDCSVVNFDSLTYAGNLENLDGLDAHRHLFVRGDIGSVEDVEAAFKKHSFDTVVNFAAESHVDRSLHFGAQVFIKTNIAAKLAELRPETPLI